MREALDELGIDERRAGQLRISILKIGLAWPIEPEGARAFCEGLEEVIVVEEKRSVIEERAAISHTAIAQAARRRQERPGGSVALLLLQVVVVLAFGVETKPMPLEMLEEGTAGGGMLQPATVAESR